MLLYLEFTEAEVYKIYMGVFRLFLAGLGVFFIAIGVPLAMLTPFPFIPIGLPVVLIGVVLLARNSLWGRRRIQEILQEHPKLKRMAPNWLLGLILGQSH